MPMMQQASIKNSFVNVTNKDEGNNNSNFVPLKPKPRPSLGILKNLREMDE